jgi:thioredoxin 1
MDIDEFRRENNIPQPSAAAPSAQAPATAGRAGPASGPQAYGWPGLRTA